MCDLNCLENGDSEIAFFQALVVNGLARKEGEREEEKRRRRKE